MSTRPAWRRFCAAAGLIAGPLLLAACGDDAAGPGALDTCPGDIRLPHVIQGDDWTSPLLDQEVGTVGVVTMATARGLYIESLEPDADPDTSEGLFLDTDLRFNPGVVVHARGRVVELGEVRDTQTALAAGGDVRPCGPPRARPETSTALPLGGRDREALENMRVTLDSRSIVTDVYRLHEGTFRVAADFHLAQPTEVARPGKEARERSARNRAASLHVRLADGDPAVFAVGDELLSDAGVLGNQGRGPLLLLEDPARLRLDGPPPVRGPVPGDLRIVSLNLANYFNGDGNGGGFPTPRGAETVAEFRQQRQRLGEALAILRPDVLAVQELENDGFGPRSAAEDLRRLLEEATDGDWAVADPNVDRVGTDEIAVGLLYRGDRLAPVGPAVTLDAAPFDLLNRTPLGQALRPLEGGDAIFIAVNHFKSKGSCPDQGRDQAQGDGQGCWNPARLAAARALAPWVRQQADERAGGNGLVVGDLNAYRMEDPVQHLLMEGFADLTATIGELHRYSYVFAGQSGTLDHALATRALARNVTGAGIPDINARYPRRLPLEPTWVGVSDHDPVLVDVRLTQSSTSD